MIISAVTVKSKTIAPPSPTMFQCRDYQIPIHLKCDGLKQCVPDGVDEIDCPAPTTPVKSILVATGHLATWTYSSDAQVVVPNEANTCSLPPVPKAFGYGTGGVIGNAIILCGGYNYEERELSTCHIFDNNSKSWKTTNMSSKRSNVASAPLNGALWISGGHDGHGSNRLSTSELVYENGTIGPGPTLPSKMADHCSVQMENGKIMLINKDGKVLIYDASTESFSDGPSTRSSGGLTACALFRSPAHGNRAVVVRVHGRGKKAEVFDFTKASEWEQISDLPTNIFDPTAITSLDGKGVYVQNDENFYELDCSTECKWIVMAQTLPKSVYGAIMMYLPPDMTCFS